MVILLGLAIVWKSLCVDVLAWGASNQLRSRRTQGQANRYLIRRSTKSLGWSVGAALVLAAVIFAFRWLGVLFVLAGLGLIACRASLRTEEAVAVVLVGFLLCSLLPIDISFLVRPGWPKILPVHYGMPAKALRDRAAKGEVVLGGCLVRGYDPLWVLVW